MKINRLKLINDVSKALPGIASGNVTVEGADSLVFLNNHIYSYNSAISVNVELSEPCELKGIVKAQEFYNCITKLPSDEIEVTVDESTWKIKDNKIKVSMKLLPAGDTLKRFESLKPSEENWIDIDGKEFNNTLKVCLIKGDTSTLNGVYFKDNIAFSTNKWIINKCNLSKNYPEFWISPNGVVELIKWDNFEKVQFEKQWLHFKSSDGAVFSVRTLATDAYPYEKINMVFENATSKNTVSEIELNEDFFKAIQRASAFSSMVEEHNVIDIQFGEEVIVKSSRNSGDFMEVVEGLATSFTEPVTMSFDVNEFLSSEKFFKKFKILSDEENIDVSNPVHVVLENDVCVKLFSSVVE